MCVGDYDEQRNDRGTNENDDDEFIYRNDSNFSSDREHFEHFDDNAMGVVNALIIAKVAAVNVTNENKDANEKANLEINAVAMSPMNISKSVTTNVMASAVDPKNQYFSGSFNGCDDNS